MDASRFTMVSSASSDRTRTNEDALGTNGDEQTNVVGEKPEDSPSRPEPLHDAPEKPAQPQRAASSVSPDHFNPSGTALQRSLTGRSSTATATVGSERFDFELFVKQSLEHGAVNGLHRELGIVFEDLCVTGVGARVALGSTFGSILATPLHFSQLVRAKRHPYVKEILQGFTGCVKPGEMLLVLGRPGSGCSSLLKTLANQRDGFHSVTGSVSYDGISPEDMAKHLHGEVAYLPENDIHLPQLTVAQTLSFAAKTRAPAKAARFNHRGEQISRREYRVIFRDVLATIFGLKHTYGTKVGNDLIRGVSGGERKRVSIAEMLTTRARIACHDNSTRGLDSSTALEYVKALRLATELAKITTILSIYQCGEQVYELFDKVAVIHEGRMIYFGPAKSAKSYFQDLGYAPQNRQTTPDYLVSVTDPKGRFLADGVDPRSVPSTAEEFARAWRESPACAQNLEEVRSYRAQWAHGKADKYKSSFGLEKAQRVRQGSPYNISYVMMVKAAFTRRIQLLLGDLATFIIVTLAAIFQAVIMGSVFYDMPDNTTGFFSRGGVMFFAILYTALTAMSEITTSYSQRPVLIRQKRYAMIRPSADRIALSLTDLPHKFVSLLLFDLIVYYLVGLQASGSQFFVFFLFTYVGAMSMIAFFRAIASLTKEESQATMIGGIAVLAIVIYTGYAIPRPSMQGWLRWLSYIQPVSFAFEALMANEFRTINFPCVGLVPSGTGYENASIIHQACPIGGSVPGSSNVNGLSYISASFEYSWSHTWRNFGIICAFWAFFLAIQVVRADLESDPAAKGGVMVFKRSTAPDSVEATAGAQMAGDVETGKEPSAETTTAHRGDQEAAAGMLQGSTDVFTWKNISYEVPVKDGTRRLLDNVSGWVEPGKMTALMGESGAGKTTLLNTLAQRQTVGIITGDMLVNGSPLPTSFQRQTGYAQQQDIHMATTTVREALQFSALLRQSASVPEKEKLDYVEEVIKMLEMQPFAEALVGEVGAGLNVEQRKRLTIGVELAAKPKLLLFLDEPSSGLDSQSAWSIISFLKKLSRHGQSILCTIHQPSGELFQQFDRLLLLRKGGQTVYFGDLGSNSKTMLDYFARYADRGCGDLENPAEYILDVIGAGAGAHTKIDWHRKWIESPESQAVMERIDSFHRELGARPPRVDPSEDAASRYAASLSTQFRMVTLRAFQNYWRNPTYVYSKLMLNVFAGVFIGLSFSSTKYDQSGLQNFLFAIFMCIVISTSLVQQLQPVFVAFRDLYEVRERPSRMYNWFVAALSSAVVEIPWNIFCGTLFFVFWFFAVGFPGEGGRGIYMWGIHMLFQVYFASFGQAVAAASPNAMVATVLFATLFSFVIATNGVMQPPALMPYFWRSWMYHLSPFTYLVSGMLSNAVGGKALHCTESQYTIVQPPAGMTCAQWLDPYIQTGTGYVGNRNATSGCQYCRFATGDEYTETLNIKYDNRLRDLGLMLAYTAFNFAALFACYYFFRIFDWSGISFSKQKDKAGMRKAGDDASPQAVAYSKRNEV